MIRVHSRPRRGVFVCSLAFAALAAAGAAFGACDTMGPSYLSSSLNKTALNTTNGPDTVRCTMTWSDDLAGVDTASCTIASPTFEQFGSCSAAAPSTGTRLNGTWACDITLPRYSRSGAWTLFQVTAHDLVGNSGQGFPTPAVVNVTSNPDTVAPAITAFSFTPTAVNVTSASQTVTCNATITDALSGVNFVNCGFRADNATPAGENHSVACNALAPSTGTRNNGTWSCTVTMPRYAQSGNWTASVLVFDNLNNTQSTPPTVPPKLVVTSSPDTAVPNLTAFSFTPTAIDPQTGAKTVECSMTFTDSPTGVSQASCSFDAPLPAFGISESCTALTPTTGTPQSGTFKCTVVIPQYAPGGMWTAGVSAYDFAGTTAGAYLGNTVDLDYIALLGRGFPYQLDVACAGGAGGEVKLGWADRNTLTWTPITGATAYFTYRQLTSQLVDLDGDGLADNGYGDCQPDANRADTSFTDASKPAAGKSYYYLVSYDAGQGEEGLGFSSSGEPRWATNPCM